MGVNNGYNYDDYELGRKLQRIAAICRSVAGITGEEESGAILLRSAVNAARHLANAIDGLVFDDEITDAQARQFISFALQSLVVGIAATGRLNIEIDEMLPRLEAQREQLFGDLREDLEDSDGETD